jgi:hypothetical protein
VLEEAGLLERRGAEARDPPKAEGGKAGGEPGVQSLRNVEKCKELPPKSVEISEINVGISKVTERSEEVSEDHQSHLAKKPPADKDRKSTSCSQVSDKITNEEIRRKTDEGILERKKRITGEASIKHKSTIKKLVDKMSQQAKFDEAFRNFKIWFELDLSAGKWEKLRKELEGSNLHLDEEQLKSVFMVTDGENNPFFSVRESAGDTQLLVRSYL